jgi:hypothetical protein
LQEKIIKFNSYTERLKEDKDDYKELWQAMEKKFLDSKVKWDNEKYDLEEKLEDL